MTNDTHKRDARPDDELTVAEVAAMTKRTGRAIRYAIAHGKLRVIDPEAGLMKIRRDEAERFRETLWRRSGWVSSSEATSQVAGGGA